MENGMTNAEFDAFLETLAQLIEAKAKTVDEAASLVRDKKSTSQLKEKVSAPCTDR